MPSANTPKRSLGNTLALLVLWVVFYGSFTLFRPALLDDADSVHAEVAREMLLRHDWVTLYANGIRYLEKAPLLYWSMAASFKVFGISTAAARIPLALTVLALAFAVEAFARRAFRNTRAGLYATLILLSSFGVFLFTRITIPDAMVCLWLTLAMLCFWLTEDPSCRTVIKCGTVILSEAKNPRISPGKPQNFRLLCYAFAAFCALNVLTKGLIGIVFPIAIVLIYLLLTRGPRAALTRLGQLHPLASGAVFLAIAAPWHILIALANPTQGNPGGLTLAHGHWSVPLPTQGNVHGWLWFYFVNEQVLRYLNLRVPRDYDTVPLWLLWGLCLIWLMPWSAFTFKAFKPVAQLYWDAMQDVLRLKRLGRVRNEMRFRNLSPQFRGYVLFVVWPAFVLVFFSFSTRQEYYVLPALPAVAILIAGWLAQDTLVRWQPVTPNAKTIRRASLRCTAVALALGTIFAAASIYFLMHARTPSANTDLATLLRQNPGDYAMSMGHFLDLNARALGLFRLPLAVAAASLFLGPLISYILRKRNHPHAATLVVAAGAFGFLLAAHLGLQTFAPVLSSQQLAATIAPRLHADDLIVIHQEYEYASTLGFYLRRDDLHILEGRSSNLWYGSFFPDAPQIFETPQSLAQKWPGPQRIFLWQDLGNQPSPLPMLPGPVYVIANSGGKQIVSNRPGG